MKLILNILFVIQLMVLSFYGLLLFRGGALQDLLSDDITLIELNFNENIESYHLFLDVLSTHSVEVSRIVFPNAETIHIYTSDLTLNGRIILDDGRFPSTETSEFISNLQTDEVNQVGTFDSFIPGFNLIIRSLDMPLTFVKSGVYHLHTSDRALVNEIIQELSNDVYYTNIIQTIDPIETTFFRALFLRFVSGLTSAFQLYEFMIASFLILLCMIFTTMQFGINKLKSSVILNIHGYTKARIIKLAICQLAKYLVSSAMVACLITLIYAQIMGYALFLKDILLYFAFTAISLITLYLVIVALTIQISLNTKKSITMIVKGKKPYFFVQLANHAIKVVFMLFLMITTYFSISIASELWQRSTALPIWGNVQDVHRVQISGIGQFSNAEMEYHFMNQATYLYQDLSENYNAFIMDSTHVENLEFWGDYRANPLSGNVRADISPNGHSIRISPNFLEINPIHAVNGIPIYEQIIWEVKTLNILVPEHLMSYEDEIRRLYLQEFYFRYVHLTNSYNTGLGIPPITTEIDDLEINIIYVESEQSYFSMNTFIRENEGLISDPIAVIYTGNLHFSDLGAWLTSSFYVQTAATDPHEEILSIAIPHGLGAAIQGVFPVYDQIHHIIQDLRESIVRFIVLFVVLILANVSITYNLVANYFEQNKYKLFVKRAFGYHSIKRNENFIMIILIYMLAIITVTSVFLSINLLWVGILLVIFDIYVVTASEKRIMKKSHAEIMKGER